MLTGIQETRQDKIFLTLNYIYVTIAFLLVAYPLVYMISASISNPKEVASGAMWLFPKDITFEGYERVLQDQRIWSGYANTILYTVVGTAVNLAFTIPAAYALSRKDLVGRGSLWASLCSRCSSVEGWCRVIC